MTTFQKQLCLHKLPLPDVIIYIIKEFAFIDISVKIKQKIDYIMILINNSKWVGRCQSEYNLRGGIFMFLINSFTNKNKKVQFGTTFCIKCGNYIIDRYTTNFRSDKIVCNCHQLTY
jgi:hypothetical protein